MHTFKNISAPQRIARTPYHALDQDTKAGVVQIPAWAEKRSVYRAEGRTLYIVETADLDEARTDLATISRAGWDVDVEPLGEGARISLTRRDLAIAA